MTTENKVLIAKLVKLTVLISLLIVLLSALFSCASTVKVKSMEGRDLKNRGWEDDDDLEIY